MVESRSGNCADWRLDRDVRICGIAHIYLFILTSCQVSFAKNPNYRTTKACRHSTESPLRPLLNFFCTVTPYYQKHLVGEMSLFECAYGILAVVLALPTRFYPFHTLAPSLGSSRLAALTLVQVQHRPYLVLSLPFGPSPLIMQLRSQRLLYLHREGLLTALHENGPARITS